jgi:hypothetical protein
MFNLSIRNSGMVFALVTACGVIRVIAVIILSLRFKPTTA